MRLYRPVDHWRSRSTFLLALCGVALGLGNWWRFAWLLGENGGAPFMLAYVLALLLLGVPLLVAELALGRIGRRAPLLSLAWVAALSGRASPWAAVAAPALLCALLIAAMAIVIGGWALAFALQQQLGGFAAISLPEAGQFFAELTSNPLRGTAWQAAGIASLVLAAAAGRRRGLGLAAWLGVPLLFVVLAVVVDFGTSQGSLDAAARYLFAGQLLDFNAESVTLATTQALYTLATGMAVGLAFGASASDEVPLLRSALAVAVIDTAVSVAVAVALLSLCFAVNLQPQEGAALLFIGLPYAFGNLALGDYYGALFFFAVFVAAMTVALALLEPLICSLTQQLRIGRLQAALLTIAFAWALAVLATFSLAEGVTLPQSALTEHFLARTSELLRTLLPFGALLIAVFAGWRVPRELLRRELCREPDFLFVLWYFALRFIVPPALVAAWLGARLLP
jgi:NSS family neurotransmitter:Na+ symporter